jgi:hypothetical protein
MATCPVCRSEAEEIEGDTFDGVWFRCLKHREFGVSDTALKTRKDAEPEQWERALKKAIERAGAEERLKILDLDFYKKERGAKASPPNTVAGQIRTNACAINWRSRLSGSVNSEQQIKRIN